MSATDWITLSLVLITAVYAYVTFRILRANEALVVQMKRQLDAEARPYVTVSLRNRMETQLIYLVVKNTGRMSAENLRLTLDDDFYQDGKVRQGRNMREWSAFSTVIEGFPPSAELQFLLGSGPELLEDAPPVKIARPTIKIGASYSATGQRFDESTIVDLRPFAMSSVPHDPVVEELARIRESLAGTGKSIADALQRIPSSNLHP